MSDDLEISEKKLIFQILNGFLRVYEELIPFLPLQTCSTNQMHLYKPRDASTPV